MVPLFMITGLIFKDVPSRMLIYFVDLYNKVNQQPTSDKQAVADYLNEFLTALAIERALPALTLEMLLLDFLPPTKELLSQTNIDYNISFEDLALLIPWISVQEDINYPMNKNCRGRRMCFERYVESVYSATSQGQSKHSLDEVI